jgi:hypothetical protein
MRSIKIGNECSGSIQGEEFHHFRAMSGLGLLVSSLEQFAVLKANVGSI